MVGWYGKWRAYHTAISFAATALIIAVQLLRFGTDATGNVAAMPNESEVCLIIARILSLHAHSDDPGCFR